MQINDLTLDVQQRIEIRASVEAVFAGLLSRLSDRNSHVGDVAMPMVLERWPGGRWFRDLGDGVGHLWGFVQVIKPPTLLEITGPMFMSYPAAGHLQLRLTEIEGGTALTLRHQVLGLITEEHRQGVTQGWEHFLNGVRGDSE